MIECRDITKVYRTGEVSTPVLHGITCTVEPGEFVALMGASGSGKTTLMNILGCLDRPTRRNQLGSNNRETSLIGAAGQLSGGP